MKTNITEFSNPEQQHQLKRENLFRELMENSFDLLALTDEQGKYLYVSDTFKQAFGYSPFEMLSTNCFDYIHPDDLPRILEQFKDLLEGKKIHVPPYRFRNAAGDWLWMEAIVTNQLNHPDIRGVVVSVRDIHQKFNSEQQAKEIQLLEAVIEGEEKERSRLARELHDGISGMLVAAKLHFNTLKEKVPQLADIPEYQHGLSLLDTAVIQVRQTSHNLMPEVLLENGLVKALDRYCSTISNDQLRVNFLALNEIERYSANFELAIYRITQELINNIIKHAKATRVFVQFSQYNNLLSLTIEDNGIGFSEKSADNGMGLKSIRKRVAAMKGNMDLHSTIGQGTSICLEFSI
jgi:PAS domain S-box-containing protein